MKNKIIFLSTKNQQSLAKKGVSIEEVRRQWSLLTDGGKKIVLDRPSKVNDGIEQLPESDLSALAKAHQEASEAGRWTKFVPASGAASRMFALKSEADRKRFFAELDRFAFGEKVKDHFRQKGIDLNRMISESRDEEAFQEVVSESGMGLGQMPKGLLPFHTYRDHSRTAFEEHLAEAANCLGTKAGAVRAHFTVGNEHRNEFEAQLREAQAETDQRSLQVDFSEQSSSTDTISMAEKGGILRMESGDPLLRPGGHGALIHNLNAIQGDLVFVKNIDNIAHEQSRDLSVEWIRILGGYLVRVQDAVHQHVRALKSGDTGAINAAHDFVQLTFADESPIETKDPKKLRDALLSRLDRPLRVCGMVKNQGEPGGGPFWVVEPYGQKSLQIVESAEIDKSDDQQQEIFSQGTHFNPVFMALGVRDERGEAFDLEKFVVEDRVIRATKRVARQSATVLERPGLWNGSMAGWNSLFVEVPVGVFSPVKSVLDLLRSEHQPDPKVELSPA